MHITNLRIRNFRSIDDLTVPLDRFGVFCGPNSCGKSNVFRAMQLAFQSSVSQEDAQRSLPSSKLVQGGPMLSVWVTCTLADIPAAVQTLSGIANTSTEYTFRLTRNGTVTRRLGANVLSHETFEKFRQLFHLVYVPPIRDLNGDGLLPFRQLIKAALQRSKGPGNVRQISSEAKKLIERKARGLLDGQKGVVRKLLHAEKLSIDASEIDIEALYEEIGLRVHTAQGDQPLSALGTGHQSAVILHLYRQLGEGMAGEVLYLFEEPDNHLHPATIRSICDDLRGISESSQVLVTTHSPVFLAHVGIEPLRPLVQTSAGTTERRNVSVLKHYTDKQVRAQVEAFGLRVTEPLLSRRVIIVEGITDRVVLSTVFELRNGKTIDQSDVLIIVAGNKDRVPLLFHLLSCLDVDVRALFDRDGAFSAEVPYSRTGLLPGDLSSGIAAITTLRSFLDSASKRGRNAEKSLAAIQNELTNGRPGQTIFDGSPLKELILKGAALNPTEQIQLKGALANGQKKLATLLLTKARVFVWSDTLESALAHNAAAMNCIEAELVAVGELSAALGASTSRAITLKNKLHEAGNRPEVLSRVVGALEGGGHFRRSEMNDCYKRLLAD